MTLLVATGGPSSSSTAAHEPDPLNSRVKRHPKRNNSQRTANGPGTRVRKASHLSPADVAAASLDPPPSYASVASGSTQAEKQQANEAKIAIISQLLREEDLYKLLGVKRNAKQDEIRRGFLNRSRSCHPDKFPNYAPATSAFQKVSFAYETLSKPSSRRMYDVSGRTDFAAAMNSGGDSSEGGTAAGGGLAGDDTLNSVLYSVFCEFMEGDFEMIRVLVNALNDSGNSNNNSTSQLGEDAIDSIEAAFTRLREIMLAGKRYLSIIRFELIRLYEIQHSLRQLSYFNITGRLKLTLQLARVTINIPLAIDTAMKTPSARDGAVPSNGQGSNGTPQDYEEDDSSSSDEEEEDGATRSRRQSGRPGRTHAAASSDDFGVAPEDDDDEAGSDSNEWSETRAEEQARQRRKAKRARRRAARRERRAKLRNGSSSGTSHEEAQSGDIPQNAALQRRGLLPNSAVGLLKGVVRVLEASEAWVPGSTSNSARGSDD